MKPSIEQIKQVAETFKGEYGIVAIRTQEESFDLGCINHVSHVWDDGDDTGIELDGISATMVSAPRDQHARQRPRPCLLLWRERSHHLR